MCAEIAITLCRRFFSMRAWMGVVGLAVADYSIGRAEGVSPPPSLWSEIEHRLGSMGLDGTMNYRLSLGGSRKLTQLGIRLEIEHRVDIDWSGQPYSSWRISGLRSSLAPAGRKDLRWQPPTGAPRFFESGKIDRGFPTAVSVDWAIRQLSQTQFQIRAPNSAIWSFENGLLIEIDHPALGRMSITTQGALITRIEDSNNNILLRATYSDTGLLQNLRIDDQAQQCFTWSSAGELVSWKDSSGKLTEWEYANRLISGFENSNGVKQNIRWAINAGYRRGDSQWPAPVHLIGANNDQYGYELTRRGFLLSRKIDGLQVGGRPTKITTLFNPRLRLLEQCFEGERLTVRFRETSKSHVALESIKNDKGEMLEHYLYDESGRLTRIHRRGRASLALQYDNLGLLIGIGEEREP